jgi:hypothetical protein
VPSWNRERLFYCLSRDHDEHVVLSLAVRTQFGNEWEWALERSGGPTHISQRVLDLNVIKEVNPIDFPLYVGWAWVSPKLADLIKNL